MKLIVQSSAMLICYVVGCGSSTEDAYRQIKRENRTLERSLRESAEKIAEFEKDLAAINSELLSIKDRYDEHKDPRRDNRNIRELEAAFEDIQALVRDAGVTDQERRAAHPQQELVDSLSIESELDEVIKDAEQALKNVDEASERNSIGAPQ